MSVRIEEEIQTSVGIKVQRFWMKSKVSSSVYPQSVNGKEHANRGHKRPTLRVKSVLCTSRKCKKCQCKHKLRIQMQREADAER